MHFLCASLTVLGARLTDRVRDDRGQTAAEYLGIIVIVAAIIAAISQTNLGQQIGSAIGSKITEIAGG
ncbi:MAG TPA: hypothetical protein VFL94_06785 [Actinomycetales bacterium]|nr:hypothetical protein [Actinomycetales bacterium]